MKDAPATFTTGGSKVMTFESLIPFMGASVYDDRAAYLKRSLINFIENVETQSLVVVGDCDGDAK